MEILEQIAKDSVRRLHNANSRLLKKHPFYAIMLVQMKYSLDIDCETAYTDGTRIAFNPSFMENLSDDELDFVLMHEVMHVALSHCLRTQENYDRDLFNIACDIVVNSNILKSNNMDLSTITLSKYGESMHLHPNGKEGYLFSAEDVYEALKKDPNSKSNSKNKSKSDESADGTSDLETENESDDNNKDDSNPQAGHFDSHGKWPSKDKSQEELDELQEKWQSRMLNAAETVLKIGKDGNSCGEIPVGLQRQIEELKNPQLDWKTILHDFVQEEVNDYSFMPPDRRMQDCDFFLPDFNEKSDKVENILFMIDTSGSMSDETITTCYSEIKGAIDQFDGKLSGSLGFFDASVVKPIPFKDEKEFEIIRPFGGGGTSFSCIFDYVRNNKKDNPPVSIIILTDGYAPYPSQDVAGDIPVLWICTTDQEIPWGKVARIKESLS